MMTSDSALARVKTLRTETLRVCKGLTGFEERRRHEIARGALPTSAERRVWLEAVELVEHATIEAARLAVDHDGVEIAQELICIASDLSHVRVVTSSLGAAIREGQERMAAREARA